LQICFGGSASGKSVFLAQRVVYDLLAGGRNYLVCRQVGRTVRGSVAQEIKKVITAWGLLNLFDINKTDGTITARNGYQCVFTGLDDVEKLKSITPAKGVFTDLWVEEATEADEHTVGLLVKRQRGGEEKVVKRVTLSFNPIMQSHWIYKSYFSGLAWADNQRIHQSSELLILKTTYTDNRFLTSQDIARLEGEKDRYRFEVYTLGNWGILGNVIFENWRVEDLSDMRNEFTNPRHGLDFGFSSDPAALICTHYDSMRKIIYVYDELYERGLTNNLLGDEVKKRIRLDDVICDSAEPKSIYELRNMGISASAAVKGKDSVNYGIQWLQQQTVIIDKACVNARNEISTYHWKEDKDGNALRIPVGKNDHLVDALRYAYESEMVEIHSGYGPDLLGAWR
jgi:phage terminase large subunit